MLRSLIPMGVGLFALGTALALPPIQIAPSAAGVAARVGFRAITVADVDNRIGNGLLRIRLEEYRQRRQVLDDIIATALLEAEAARRGITVQALVQQEVDGKARKVTDEEAAAVYESTRERFAGTPEAQAVQSIAAGIQRQRVSKRRQEFLAELRSRLPVEVYLTPPRIEVDPSDDPARGPASAPVTIVEFSDFQCPYCAQMTTTLRSLEATYPTQVRLVFRDFPLPMHKEAAKAAEAATCAHEQGRFWEMHDRLFANQKSLAIGDLKRYAGELGLDQAKFAACLDGNKYPTEWQADRSDGEKYGINGTSALFVNGRPVFGMVPLAELSQIVEEELARVSAELRRR